MSSDIYAFGSLAICERAPFPVCDILNFPQQCVLKHPVPGITNLAELIVCALSIAAAVYFILRCRMKKAAVGRLEMIIFFLWYFLAVVLELVIGGIGLGAPASTYVGALQVGSTAAAFVALFLNGFVGYQWLDDGTTISLLGIFGTSALYGIVAAYFAADASLQINFKTSPGSPINIPLYVCYFIVPVICVGLYVITAAVLVFMYLRSRRPLGLLLGAFLAFVLAAMFALFVSFAICQGTSGAIDGRFLVTFWIAMAVWWVFRFWDSITEDTWEDEF